MKKLDREKFTRFHGFSRLFSLLCHGFAVYTIGDFFLGGACFCGMVAICGCVCDDVVIVVVVDRGGWWGGRSGRARERGTENE